MPDVIQSFASPLVAGGRDSKTGVSISQSSREGTNAVEREPAGRTQDGSSSKPGSAVKQRQQPRSARGYRVYLPTMRKTIIDRRIRLPVIRRFRLFNTYLFVSLPRDAGPQSASCGPAGASTSPRHEARRQGLRDRPGTWCADSCWLRGMANSMTSPSSAGDGCRRN